MHYTSVSARRCVVFMNLEMGCHPLAFVESGAMACHPLEVGAMGLFSFAFSDKKNCYVEVCFLQNNAWIRGRRVWWTVGCYPCHFEF